MLTPLPIALALILSGAVSLAFGRRRGGFRLAASGIIPIMASWGPAAEHLLAPAAGAAPYADRRHRRAGLGGRSGSAGRRLAAEPGLADQRAAQREFGDPPARGGAPAARPAGGAIDREQGEPYGGRPVASGYAQAAPELGVPAELILILDTPLDTAQKAYAVKAVLGTDRPILLVTSASHMACAMRHFEMAGLAPIAAPTHFQTRRREADRLKYRIPSANQLRETERAVHEYLGLLALLWDHRER